MGKRRRRAERWTEADAERVVEQVDTIPGRLIEARGADEGGSRIFGVQIIQSGDSKNKRRYPESVLSAAARLYEGAKAYDHHRTDEELRTSTIAGLVGSFRNVKVNGTGLEADLRLLPGATHTAEALDASLANQLEGLPPLVGISHDVMARYRQVSAGGRRVMEATEICSVNSADVVADPAAGGRATRMVAGGTGDTHMSEEDDEMTLKELLALLRGSSPEKRAELLKEHAAVLDDAGLTADDIKYPEPPAAAPVTPEKELVGVGARMEESTRSVESDYSRTSPMGRMLINAALTEAQLDARLAESIAARLPERFTEAELSRTVEMAQSMAVEFEKAGLTPSVPHVEVTQDSMDKKRERLFESLDTSPQRKPGTYMSIRHAYFDITGANPNRMFGDADVNRMILRESIGDYDSSMRSLESVSSTTWNTVLGDAITRRMVADYQMPTLQDFWDLVSSVVPITDFRTQRIERLGGYNFLPLVNEGAPYQPLTSPTNEEVTYAITKKGGTEDLTLETIANDDLGAVARIPRALGRAAAATLYKYVWDLIFSNPTMSYDSVALFNAGHGNTDTNALSGANLATGVKKMRKQVGYGDQTALPLSPEPKYLLYSTDLDELAQQLVTSAVALPSGAPVGAASNIPNVYRGLIPKRVDYWSTSSTTFWGLVADPNMVPTIELGFYQGRRDPELFTQSDPNVGSPFDADKVTYKIRHIYAGSVLDHRAFYRGNA